jgi:catechol 2,3-dioxygenase-like lactoylglutathione lyase family enzyme
VGIILFLKVFFMENVKGIYKEAWPYQKDKMNLPVSNVDDAIPFYEAIMGFRLVSRESTPYNSAVLERDGIQIGLAENGGDPSQEGCFFEVVDVEAAFAELKSNGLAKDESEIGIEKHENTSWKVFYIVAPDGLCFCLGERVKIELRS